MTIRTLKSNEITKNNIFYPVATKIRDKEKEATDHLHINMFQYSLEANMRTGFQTFVYTPTGTSILL